MIDVEGRHPATVDIVAWFGYEHLCEGSLPREVSRKVHRFVDDVLAALPEDGPELSAGLRKLLEAKDCFVRHAVRSEAAAPGGSP